MKILNRMQETAGNKTLRSNINAHQKGDNPFKSSPEARKMIPININGSIYLVCPDTGRKLLASNHF